MSFETGPSPNPKKEFASLQGCFIEGSSEQRTRERRIRRRALVISIAVQSALLALIILLPLFGKPEHIAFASYVPIPPYYHSSAPAHHEPQSTPPVQRHFVDPCATCYHPNFAPHPVTHDDRPPQIAPPGIGPDDGRQSPVNQWGIGLDDSRPQPARPVERPQRPQRIFEGHIEPAMLIYRVEPIYPPLARQIRLSGSVQLHAIIAADGTIQSLQVVSGHPLLLQSALDAVRQWRYRPTVLDGQPVEVDTYITVIYSLAN